MINPAKLQSIMPVVVLLVFSGCAKQPLQTNDTPLGGHLPNVPLTQPVPADALATPTQRYSPQPQADSVLAAGKNDNGEVTKKPEGPLSAATTAPLQAALRTIYFDFDSSDLSTAARQTLVENHQVLQKNATMRIRIEGNCDERGSDEYNLALGERRAQAAARYLTTLGISGERLSTISLGEEKPAVAGHDEIAWAKNRRDEFVITER